jgi:hypothetical protein
VNGARSTCSDWRALERARVQRPHVLPADVDYEQFRTIDHEYLALPNRTEPNASRL